MSALLVQACGFEGFGLLGEGFEPAYSRSPAASSAASGVA